MTAAPCDDAWSEAAIAQSWKRVVDDYTVFDGVRARGGTVADIPSCVPDDVRQEGPARTPAASGDVDGGNDAAAAPEAAPTAAAAALPMAASQSIDTSPPAMPGMTLPQTVLGSTGDDALKKLLMSWYYAGYYTGLYEGQQQAAQSGQTDTKEARP